MTPVPAFSSTLPPQSQRPNDPLLCPKGVSCVMTSGACRLVSRNLAWVIFSIGAGLITSALVMKFVKVYSKRTVVRIKECLYYKHHIRIAAAAAIVIALIGISWLHIGVKLGFLLGCYSAINLGVESKIQRLQPKKTGL
jgi:hypothetical protein